MKKTKVQIGSTNRRQKRDDGIGRRPNRKARVPPFIAGAGVEGAIDHPNHAKKEHKYPKQARRLAFLADAAAGATHGNPTSPGTRRTSTARTTCGRNAWWQTRRQARQQLLQRMLQWVGRYAGSPRFCVDSRHLNVNNRDEHPTNKVFTQYCLSVACQNMQAPYRINSVG